MIMMLRWYIQYKTTHSTNDQTVHKEKPQIHDNTYTHKLGEKVKISVKSVSQNSVSVHKSEIAYEHHRQMAEPSVRSGVPYTSRQIGDKDNMTIQSWCDYITHHLGFKYPSLSNLCEINNFPRARNSC